MQNVSKKTKEMTKRLFLRSAVLLALTVIGFFAMHFMVEYARQNHGDFVSQFPEVMMVLGALTLLTWVEISVIWIRVTFQPKVDLQELACMAIMNNDTRAGIAVYAINTLTTLTRIVLVLLMSGLL